MKTPEEQDPTWELLLKSKPQQPSPHFVRNVVREARKLEVPESGLSAVFAWFKKPAIAVPVAIGACAILISAINLIQGITPTPVVNSPTLTAENNQDPATSITSPVAYHDDTQTDVAEDLERIDYMSDLVAITDPSKLDDAALANLFY